jgi:hypothetical protein
MIVCWNLVASEEKVIVELCDDFVAWGMHRVYGRDDHFGLHRVFHMDIWSDKKKRLLMRFWSLCKDVDWLSFEIKGIDVDKIPKCQKGAEFDDRWLPKEVRTAYEEWICE